MLAVATLSLSFHVQPAPPLLAATAVRTALPPHMVLKEKEKQSFGEKMCAPHLDAFCHARRLHDGHCSC